jgi:hypothetical protein
LKLPIGQHMEPLATQKSAQKIPHPIIQLPAAQPAVARLLKNLDTRDIPETADLR